MNCGQGTTQLQALQVPIFCASAFLVHQLGRDMGAVVCVDLGDGE